MSKPVDPLHLEHLELLLELSLPFGLLLSSADIEGLSAGLFSVEVVASGLSLLGLLEADEAKALGVAGFRISHDLIGRRAAGGGGKERGKRKRNMYRYIGRFFI